ncbi:MAG: hypothetical protein ABSE46_25895 [Terracidiphilus sp.]|jgi:hypothetical protein
MNLIRNRAGNRTGNRTRALYHMVRADFLERVRRYSFLLTLGFSVYLGYIVYAGQVTLRLDKYSGINNSAWLGSVIGLVGSVWLTLVGFYVVKNSIQRDRQTRVGQILATTPISKSFYTLAKALSNFAVLAAMIFVLALAAFVIQISQGTDASIDGFALVSPVLIFGLSAVAVTAALAVLFESLPVLRGGLGNILYFFLWTFLIAFGAGSLDSGASLNPLHTMVDYTGIATVMGQMQSQVHGLDPAYSGGASFSVGGLNPTTKTFLWNGLVWTPALALSRAMLFAIAAGLALVAAIFFDRFDPARANWLPQKKPKAIQEIEGREPALAQRIPAETIAPMPHSQLSAASLAPLSRTGAHARFLTLVLAELRLMIRGHAWWWYTVAAGLFIACLASPLDVARSGVIVAAWIWPALIWSQMGTREAQYSTGSLVFSARRPVPQQLLATYAAGVIVAALAGGGLGVHLLFARDVAGLAGWAAGALFIPALALALGVTTGTRKFFEALYTAWWYVGPLHHMPKADFMGTTAQSSTPGGYLAAAAVLVLIACTWRAVKLANA